MSVEQDGKEKKTVSVSFPAGENTVSVTVPAPAYPGWTLTNTKRILANGKTDFKSTICGAVTAPDKITAGHNEPADFKLFWDFELKHMRSADMKPQLTRISSSSEKKVRVYSVHIPIENGNSMEGILSMPLKCEKHSLPAIIQYCGASTYGISSASLYYSEKAITLQVSPHCAESGHDRKYYSEYANQYLREYPFRNADNKNLYYMKFMILRAVMATDFVRSLPEWNQRDLIVHGESQGGFQSLAAAALVPEVSLCISMVPAMTDHAGYLRGHKNGWPGLLDKNCSPDMKEKILAASAYFDCVNFAKYVNCEIYLSTGLLDTTCPPTGVIAARNRMKNNPKVHFYIVPKSGHNAGCPDAGKLLDHLLLGK